MFVQYSTPKNEVISQNPFHGFFGLDIWFFKKKRKTSTGHCFSIFESTCHCRLDGLVILALPGSKGSVGLSTDSQGPGANRGFQIETVMFETPLKSFGQKSIHFLALFVWFWDDIKPFKMISVWWIHCFSKCWPILFIERSHVFQFEIQEVNGKGQPIEKMLNRPMAYDMFHQSMAACRRPNLHADGAKFWWWEIPYNRGLCVYFKQRCVWWGGVIAFTWHTCQMLVDKLMGWATMTTWAVSGTVAFISSNLELDMVIAAVFWFDGKSCAPPVTNHHVAVVKGESRVTGQMYHTTILNGTSFRQKKCKRKKYLPEIHEICWVVFFSDLSCHMWPEMCVFSGPLLAIIVGRAANAPQSRASGCCTPGTVVKGEDNKKMQFSSSGWWLEYWLNWDG